MKSFFPPAKNNSVANQYHQYQMSKNAIKTLGEDNSTTANTVKKMNRIAYKKGRTISISNGGILTKSARAIGSMDRLARLKAAAMNK